jgi:hypothetical protein
MENSEPNLTCPQCGEKDVIPEMGEYCPYCGHFLGQSEQDAISKYKVDIQPTNFRERLYQRKVNSCASMWPACGMLFCVIGFGFLYFVSTHSEHLLAAGLCLLLAFDAFEGNTAYRVWKRKLQKKGDNLTC